MPGKLLTWRGEGLGFFGLGRLFWMAPRPLKALARGSMSKGKLE